jgi:uncharacterized DUF497 family protein
LRCSYKAVTIFSEVSVRVVHATLQRSALIPKKKFMERAMFDWDRANIAHIAEHGIEPIEAEEAVTYRPVFVQYLSRGGEDRFMQVGETLAGRVLVVVITPRNGLTRVVTA